MVLITLAIAVPTMAAAVAGQSSNETSSPVAGGPLPWTLEMSVEEDEGFAYTNARIDADVPARMTGIFDLQTAELTLRYRSPPPGIATEDRQRRANLTLDLSTVYEYRDTNGNQRFDLGDQVIQAHGIEGGPGASVERLDPSGLIQGARAEYPIDDLGRLALEVRPAARPEPFGGTVVEPTAPLVNVSLDQATPSADDARIAVMLRVGTHGLEQTGPHQVAATGEGARALFEWAPNATVDGRPVPVNQTVLKQHLDEDPQAEQEMLVLLATPQGEATEHAAQVRIEHTRNAVETALGVVKGDELLFSLGLVASVTIFGGSAWAKLRGSDEGSGERAG